MAGLDVRGGLKPSRSTCRSRMTQWDATTVQVGSGRADTCHADTYISAGAGCNAGIMQTKQTSPAVSAICTGPSVGWMEAEAGASAPSDNVYPEKYFRPERPGWPHSSCSLVDRKLSVPCRKTYKFDSALLRGFTQYKDVL